MSRSDAESVEGEVVSGSDVAVREKTEGALTLGGLSRSEAIQLGQVMAASGYFADARQAAQGAVKILAGQELGIPPVAALRGIDFIDGSISLSGEMVAGLVRKSDRYDYRVVESTNERCEVRFSMDGEELEPTSVFDLDDAKRAELVGGSKARANWTRYPKMMLFWRAMTQGVRLHCPELAAGGPVYVPEELDPDVTVDGTGAIKRPDPAAPVTSDEGKALIEKCRTVAEQIREQSRELMPPAMFNTLLLRHQHDEGRLRDLVEHLEGLRDAETEINALISQADEAVGANETEEVVQATKGRKQAERKAALEDLIDNAASESA